MQKSHVFNPDVTKVKGEHPVGDYPLKEEELPCEVEFLMKTLLRPFAKNARSASASGIVPAAKPSLTDLIPDWRAVLLPVKDAKVPPSACGTPSAAYHHGQGIRV
jgi:hypothetical protein